MIGIQLATTDGVLSKAGGQVVKNVAGYDLSKLVTGSFGSLAAIVSATFKLSPLPARVEDDGRSRCATPSSWRRLVRMVMASQLEPIAFEIDDATQTRAARLSRPAPVRVVLCRVVDAQIAHATAALQGRAPAIEVLEGDAERAAVARSTRDGSGNAPARSCARAGCRRT